MGVMKRALAIILAMISLALGTHFVAGEIYGVYVAGSHLVWDYLNLFIAFAVVVTLAYHYNRKRSLDRQHRDDSVSFNYLATNFMLFAAMFLTFWFFANWFEELNTNGEPPGAVVGFVWIAFNASFVILGGITAWQLWQNDTGTEESGGEQELQPGPLLATPQGLAVEGQSVAEGPFTRPMSSTGDASSVPGGQGKDSNT